MDRGKAGQGCAAEIHTALAISDSCREEQSINNMRKHNLFLLGLRVELALQTKAVKLGFSFH